MQFDLYGNLTPYTLIGCSWAVFNEKSIDEFEDSTVRKALVSQFEAYIEVVKTLFPLPFDCWVNGSFVTRKMNPNDLDCVFFLPNTAFEKHEKIIDALRKQRHSAENQIDAYFVAVYPEGHKRRFWYESDQVRWLHAFGTSLANRSKGIIKLTINDD
jgi:hypothetical protein